jgi:CRISPR-associated protein Csd1
MILQSLCGYYDRLAANPSSNVPVMGYEVNNVSSCITLDTDGNVTSVISLLNDDKKPINLITPIQPKRAGQRPEAAFLCENPEVIFGIYKNEEGAEYRFHASKKIHEIVLKNVDDAGATAILRFFEKRERAGFPILKRIRQFWKTGEISFSG